MRDFAFELLLFLCWLVRACFLTATAPFLRCPAFSFASLFDAFAAGAASAGAGVGLKRPRSVAFDVLPVSLRDTIISVRDLEAKHKSVSIAVPDTWEALLERLREECGYSDSHRLYYSTGGLEPAKKKLASAADFVVYTRTLRVYGRLPDIWLLRAAVAEVPSPDQLPTVEAAAAGAADGASSSGRSSAQQSSFRNALLRRDASGADPHCALCGTDSDIQAAHILPQKRTDQFTTEDGLDKAMEAAGLVDLYDVRNGFLLCDQCMTSLMPTSGRWTASTRWWCLMLWLPMSRRWLPVLASSCFLMMMQLHVW
jgi:hypothetical protein